ncbi:MAG: calcium/sodium antiporter [Flavobacteriaceae bacterium]
MEFVYIVLGLVILVVGGEFLLKGAVSMSLKLSIPKAVIGMTVVSFATSAPELIVSVQSALNDHADIALGNVVGSNIANLGFVLGITLLLTRLEIGKSFARIDWPVMMLASVMLFLFIYFDGLLDQYEGSILFLMLILYLFLYLKYYKRSKLYALDHLSDEEEEVDLDIGKSWAWTLFFLSLGGLGLWAGSELLISGSVDLAVKFGVSERVIGITIVSIGTSIPELAASVIAVMRKEKAISLGNLIGSNIFNIFAVLGLTSMITPIRVGDTHLLSNDLIWMLGFALAILPLIYAPNRRSLAWKEGLILLGAYVIFIFSTI